MSKHDLQVGDHVAVKTLPNSPMGVIGSVKHTEIALEQRNTIYIVFMDNPEDAMNGRHYARAGELINLTSKVLQMHKIAVGTPAYCH